MFMCHIGVGNAPPPPPSPSSDISPHEDTSKEFLLVGANSPFDRCCLQRGMRSIKRRGIGCTGRQLQFELIKAQTSSLCAFFDLWDMMYDTHTVCPRLNSIPPPPPPPPPPTPSCPMMSASMCQSLSVSASRVVFM